MKYFLFEKGEVRGPFEANQVKHWTATGALDEDAQAHPNVEGAQWAPVNAWPDLITVPQPLPPRAVPVAITTNPISVVWRWIAFIPAAFAAAFVIQVIFVICQAMTGNHLPDAIIQAINSGVSAWAFIYAGAFTAPARRVSVAYWLALSFGLLNIFLLPLVPTKQIAFAASCSVIAGVVCAMAFKQFKKDYPSNE